VGLRHYRSVLSNLGSWGLDLFLLLSYLLETNLLGVSPLFRSGGFFRRLEVEFLYSIDFDLADRTLTPILGPFQQAAITKLMRTLNSCDLILTNLKAEDAINLERSTTSEHKYSL
jgi:hypothetical protein